MIYSTYITQHKTGIFLLWPADAQVKSELIRPPRMANTIRGNDATSPKPL